jgi:hypothetical protein
VGGELTHTPPCGVFADAPDATVCFCDPDAVSATSPSTTPVATASSGGGAADLVGRTTLIWLSVVVSLQVRPFAPALLMPVLLVAGLVVNIAVVCRWWGQRRSTSPIGSPRVAAWVLVSTGLLLAGYDEVHFAARLHPGLQPILLVAFMLLGVGACGVTRSGASRRASFVAFVLVAAALQVAMLNHVPPPGDVGVASHQSVTALLHGHDPYAITLPNPYDRAQTRQFFDPVDLVGNRLDFGYAYLPVALVGSIPGFLVGNVGYSLVLALTGLTVLLRRLAVDATGRMLALVPLAMPFTPQILLNQWVEPIPMLLLGVCAWAWVGRRRRVATVGLGLLLATKQYFFVVLPLLVVVRRGLGTRATAAAIAVTGAVCGAFVLWDPAAFWHSAVWLQFHLPLREDSVSLPVAWGRTFGTAPWSLLGPVALLAGVLVSALVSWRGGSTATAFCVGSGLSLLATVVLSPHAFANYYALIEVALVIGCITWAGETAVPRSPGTADSTREDDRRPPVATV